MASAAPAGNPYRDPDYMFKLLNNPFSPRRIGLPPVGNGFTEKASPAYRLVDAGLHGKMPPEDLVKTNPFFKPVVTVMPDIMIIMAAAGEFGGHESTTCNLAYEILTPAVGALPRRPIEGHPPPNILHLFGQLLGIHPPRIASHLYYAAPGERIGNRILTLEANSRAHAAGSAMENRGSEFGMKELTILGYTPLHELEKIIHASPYNGTITVDHLQSIIDYYMKPTAKNPIILYINACDVSLKSNAPPR